MEKETFKIQKIIAERGFCSRREAEGLILNKKVYVNNNLATIGDRFSKDVAITINGKSIVGDENEKKIYYILNKPEKVISSSKDNFGRRTVIDLVPAKPRVFAIGRLDYNTTGTILLTNDGELAHRLQHPKWEIVRVYRARLNETLTNDELRFLNSSNGKIIDDKVSTHRVAKVDKKSYIVVVRQGFNHHVKKIFALVDKEVINLTRVEFAGLTHVNRIKKGSYEPLSNHEVKNLKRLVDL